VERRSNIERDGTEHPLPYATGLWDTWGCVAVGNMGCGAIILRKQALTGSFLKGLKRTNGQGYSGDRARSGEMGHLPPLHAEDRERARRYLRAIAWVMRR
jgi:hypothetical protein